MNSVLLVIVAVLLSAPVIRAGDGVYYVTADSDSGQCPTNDNCHTLSYYVDSNSFSRTINATFIFMEGRHKLGTNVSIDSAQNMTLKLSSKYCEANIDCATTVSLRFGNSTSIAISGISFSNCGTHTSGALAFHHISLVSLESIVIADSYSRGIVMNQVEHAYLSVSTFNNNGRGGIEALNVSSIIVEECNFTNNSALHGKGEGGGLKISTSYIACPTVDILHSRFTNNTALYGGGLLIDIQCGNVTVDSSHFSHNTVERLGGGVRVHVSNGTGYPNFTFVQSTFEYNTIMLGKALKDEPSGGGGVYMYISQVQPTTSITVLSCAFIGNNGQVYGGGLAINRNTAALTIHKASEYLVHTTIKSCLFESNIAGYYGTAMSIRYISANVSIIDCSMFNNTGISPIYFPETIALETDITYLQILCNVLIRNCNFSCNHGYSIRTDSFLTSLTVIDTLLQDQFGGFSIIPVNSFTLQNVSIVSCKILPAIELQCTVHTTVQLTDIYIANNENAGVFMMNCGRVTFYGNNMFANNEVIGNGGGLALRGFSSLRATVNSTLTFRNNTAGKYGGAIYAEQIEVVSSFSFFYYCSFLCDYYRNPINFEMNKAMIAGDNVYGGNYYYCNDNGYGVEASDYIYSPNRTSMLQPAMPSSWKQPSSRSALPNSVVSSDPIAMCFCHNNEVNCSKVSTSKSGYPGEPFNVTIAIVGIGGGVNRGSFITTTTGDVELESASNNFIANAACETFTYTPRTLHTNLTMNITLNISLSSFMIADGYINITLTILPCPLGLVLDSTTKSCVCDSVLQDKYKSSIKCNMSWMPYPIQHYRGSWVGYDKQLDCMMALDSCPFDYCTSMPIKFSLNESDIDLQCNYNRTGILCGRCKPGLSVLLGSNRCSKCSDNWLALVMVFAACGVLLVVLLMILNLTVSVGSINGILFYANIVKLNEPAFFPQGNIPVVSQFIAWLNLDWGIETCFFDGLDGYWKVTLQFVFPLYLWLLVAVIVVGCRYSGRLCHMCGRNAVPVLATLILMSYTKLLRTVTKALVVNKVQCGDVAWSVWNVDGNIVYLNGKHIGLFLLALVFLFVGLVYTGLVFSSQWLQRYSGKCCRSRRDPVVRLKPLIDAYTGPYKDQYRFWTGLGLIIRAVLTVIFSFTSEQSTSLNNYFILLTMLLPLVGNRVYRHSYVTVVEIFSQTNLFLLVLVTTALNSDSRLVSLITTASVGLELMLFLAIAIVHSIVAVMHRHNRGKQLSRFNSFQKNYGAFSDVLISPAATSASDVPATATSSVVHKRETLIYDD